MSEAGQASVPAGEGASNEHIQSELPSLFSMQLPARPYPGLRAFEKSEWPIFFGRERMGDEVVDRLIAQRLLVIHGDSGCGKSSLVRAGVLPRLEQGNARGGMRWRTATALPREAPLLNLAIALASLDGRGDDEERVLEIRRALNLGRQAPLTLADLVRRDEADHVCILIDQFEELFDHARRHGSDEAQQLVQVLNGLFEHPPEGLYAVLTMRSEFLGSCARYKGFAETVNATQYLLPRMEHDDLLRAIREPAGLYGGRIDEDLAERLIVDVGGSQDQLPLIQHGLMLMHRDHGTGPAAAEGWRLGTAQFDAEGGLAKLLSDHADAVMRQAHVAMGDPDGQQCVVENLFRALTDVNADGHAIRRRRTLLQLSHATGASEESLRAAIAPFRADGVSFLQPHGSGPMAEGALVDVSHEALIRCWSALADPKDGWLVREFRNGLVWRSLLVQAESFERDPRNVLSFATLIERRDWLASRNAGWAERYGGGWDRVGALIEASDGEHERRVAEEAAAAQARREVSERVAHAQRLKQKMWYLGVAGGVAVVLLGATLWQVLQKEEAIVAEKAARESAEAAAAQAAEGVAGLKRVVAELQRTLATPVITQAVVRQSLDKAETALKEQTTGLSELGLEKSLAPRIYVHISEESQRSAARAFEAAFEARALDKAKLVVPGIQRVSNAPPRAVLRCFRAEECRSEGPRLVAIANQIIESPKLVLDDMSAVYGNSSAIRDRHYEIWFPPGPLTVKAGKTSAETVRK